MMRDAATFEPVESRVTKPEFWSGLPARWTSDVEETLVCCQVRQETHDVKSFFFRSPEGRAFVFEPGPYSPYTEGLVEKFSDWYVQRLAAHVESPVAEQRTINIKAV